MYGRALFFVVLIVVGAVLPYLIADDAWLDSVERLLSRNREENVAGANDERDFVTRPPATAKQEIPIISAGARNRVDQARRRPAIANSATAVPSPIPRRPVGRAVEFPTAVGPPGVPLEVLLSFEVTPDWVSANWSRVTTRLAELDLEGWRVPILTGDAADDVAGSLTYYFDEQRRLQRIVLHGYTANTARIVELATSRYRMQRIPMTGCEVYAAAIADQPLGALRLGCPAVIKSKGLGNEVLMELNRSGSAYGMSHEFRDILQLDRPARELEEAKKWERRRRTLLDSGRKDRPVDDIERSYLELLNGQADQAR